MMMRQSCGGVASTTSIDGAMLRPNRPARSTARRPPNSGTVWASSASRARIGRQFLAVDARQRERIGGIVDRGAHQRIDALAHQPGIGAVDQHDRLRRIGLGDEAVDFGGL